jgi:hypothetical protein
VDVVLHLFHLPRSTAVDSEDAQPSRSFPSYGDDETALTPKPAPPWRSGQTRRRVLSPVQSQRPRPDRARGAGHVCRACAPPPCARAFEAPVWYQSPYVQGVFRSGLAWPRGSQTPVFVP